jgi:large subunit ribosomal protein L25
MSTIAVTTRPKSSSAAVERLRKEGILPMAILRRTRTTDLIQANARELRDVLSGKEGLKIFPLEVEGGDKMKVVVKQIDRHPITRKVTTMVLQEVQDTDVIKISIPIVSSGAPRAVAKNQAALIQGTSSVDVQGMVKDLPDVINVDLSKMRQNDRILLGEVALPEGVVYITSPEAVIASTVQMRGMADFNDDIAEAGDAPAEAPAEA